MHYKRGCVVPMVIWPAFRMGQYRVNDHPYHAPQFIITRNYNPIQLTKISKRDFYQNMKVSPCLLYTSDAADE